MKKIVSVLSAATLVFNVFTAKALVWQLDENSHFYGPVMVPVVESAMENTPYIQQADEITAAVSADTVSTLEAAVAAFESLDISAYSTQSYYACFDEYEAAKSLLLNSDATEEQKSAALSALENAMSELKAADSIVRSDTIIGEDASGKGPHGTCNESYSYKLVMKVASIPTAPHQNRACINRTLYGGFDFGENNEKVISRVAFSAISNSEQIARSYVGLLFEGSNDNISWETIAEVKEPLSISTASVATAYYSSVQTKAYRYVRFNTDKTFGRNEIGGGGIYDGKLLGIFFFSPVNTYEAVFPAAIEKYSACCDGAFADEMSKAVENANELLSSGSANDFTVNTALKAMLDIKVMMDAEQVVLASANNVNEYAITSQSWFDLQNSIKEFEKNASVKTLEAIKQAVNGVQYLDEKVFTSSTVFGDKRTSHSKINNSCGDITVVLGADKTTLAAKLPDLKYRVCLAMYLTGGYDFGEGNEIAVSKVSFAYQSNYQGLANEVRNLKFEGSADGNEWKELCSVPSTFVGAVDTSINLSYETLNASDVSAYRYVRFNSEKLPFSDSNSGKLLSLLFYGYVPETSLLENTIAKAKEFLAVYADEELSANVALAQTAVAESTTQPQVNNAIVSLEQAIEKAQNNVYGDEITPRSYEESSIRIDEPDGIRFKSSVTNTVKGDSKTTEYGFIVTLESLVGNNSIVDDLKFDNDNKIRFVYGISYGYDESVGRVVERIYSKDDNDTYFTAVVFGVKTTAEALAEKIIVRPYIKYNGETLYGTPMSKSVLDVAKLYRDSGYKNLTEHGKEYIQSILTTCNESV